MSKVVEYQRHKPEPSYFPDWWVNAPTDEIFIDIDIAVPDGFKVAERKTLSYLDFSKSNRFVRVRLYAKPLKNNPIQEQKEEK
jgi:hypothetical protein